MIKHICIEDLKQKGKSLGQVHSVPALLCLPERNYLFGKQVFDFLLLPGRGKLVVGKNPTKYVDEEVKNPVTTEVEPSAFNMGCGGYADSYSMIDDDKANEGGEDFKLYNWTSIESFNDDSCINISSMNEESRPKKELPDINEYKARRDYELNQKDVNTKSLPPSMSGRA